MCTLQLDFFFAILRLYSKKKKFEIVYTLGQITKQMHKLQRI